MIKLVLDSRLCGCDRASFGL